eukprot:6706734-Alexandrium_andersonii.AAC.1
MSASLVGSEMCIRDSGPLLHPSSATEVTTMAGFEMPKLGQIRSDSSLSEPRWVAARSSPPASEICRSCR